MNIETFNTTYAQFKDADKIQIRCDHPEHVGTEPIEIGKQPAKRNILKNNSEQFICRACYMVHNNPMNQSKDAVQRTTDEEITVHCPHPDHQGETARVMKKTSYYGAMTEPYQQICKSCSLLGREMTDATREAIGESLTGIKRSEEFKQKCRDYMKHNPEGIARGTKNILENPCRTGMLGKTHSEITKALMSASHSGKTFTEEHKKNISEGRKKMLAETGGFTPEHKEKLRRATLAQYKRGFDPKSHHLNGWHQSPKAADVYYRSSYEKKAFLKLDTDENVKTYSTEQVSATYYNSDKKASSSYLIDLKIEYVDGSIELIEVKPFAWLDNHIVQAKLDAGRAKATELGMKFSVWTEIDLFGPIYNPHLILQFADNLRHDPDIQAKRKVKSSKSTKKHYENHIKNNKITVFCEFCCVDHTIMKFSYDNNVSKNGRYICLKENGSLIGSKVRVIDDPYAKEGKKLCTKCKQILDFEQFGKDRTRRDGYANKCRNCRKV